MEIKKSPQADLDGKRTQSFVMGLVVVLTLLFVALEFDWAAGIGDEDDQQLDNVIKELDLDKLKEEERIPLLKQQVVERPQSADKLNVVTDDPQVELKDEVPPPKADDDRKVVDKKEDEQPEVVDMQMNPLNFRIVEQLPEFPGGATAFMKWLTKTLRYPPVAQQNKTEGKVVVQFIVNKDGSVSNIEVLKSVDATLDAEALRVMRLMPKWKAGQEAGKPCRTQVCIPIVFKL
jgi:protein TonB